NLDIRVSTIPGTHGECMCMRILDKRTGLLGMEEMGFSGADYKRFQDIIKKPNGIFLVTGPTGSGKTTTLYAARKELNKPGVKPFLVASSVQAIMGQRLIRRLCPNCKEVYTPVMEELNAIGLKPKDMEGKTVYKAVGCDACKLGYKGRQAIFELMEMSPIIR